MNQAQSKIVDAATIAYVEDHIENINKAISEYKQEMDVLIKNFESSGIVQNFFTVGGFGKAQQEKIIKIRAAVDEFYNVICQNGGLIAKTREYLEGASSLNRTGKM